MNDSQQFNELLKELIPDPKWLVSELDKTIIGQEAAKKALSIAVMQKRIRDLHNNNIIFLDNPLKKGVLLLIGSTGTGKTALVKTIAGILDCPISTYDASVLTSAGYIGGKVEDIVKNHLIVCNESFLFRHEFIGENKDNRKEYIEKLLVYAETGIVHLDEFDKCRRTGTDNTTNRDINGQAVQQELLKLFEESEIIFNEDKDNKVPFGLKKMSTKNLFVVCTGAFVGLDKIVHSRFFNNETIGFSGNVFSKDVSKNTITQVVQDDLILYGIIPELVGRISSIGVLKDLTKQDLKNILLNSKESIFLQFKEMFQLFKIKLVFTEDALDIVVQKALDLKTGARALNSILYNLLEPLQYDIFDNIGKELVINDGYIKSML